MHPHCSGINSRAWALNPAWAVKSAAVVPQHQNRVRLFTCRMFVLNSAPGMQRSRAWCGTPPILGVVNMVGTRNFTCYMGAP